jgi:hypothetical protein
MLVLLIICGCAGPQNNLPQDVALLETNEEGLNPSALALLQEAKRHARTRVAGAATGGVVGAIASVLPSQGQSGGARGAIVGGAGGVGAVLGYAFGEYIDARNIRATMDQEKLNMLIRAAQRDAAGYERDRINAERAIEETQRAVARLNREYATLSNPQHAYQEQTKVLSVTAASLQGLVRELQANIAIMSQDVLEAQDNRAISDTKLHPENLEAERVRLQEEHDGLVAQYEALFPVVDTIPPQFGQDAIRQVISGLTPQ